MHLTIKFNGIITNGVLEAMFAKIGAKKIRHEWGTKGVITYWTLPDKMNLAHALGVHFQTINYWIKKAESGSPAHSSSVIPVIFDFLKPAAAPAAVMPHNHPHTHVIPDEPILDLLERRLPEICAPSFWDSVPPATMDKLKLCVNSFIQRSERIERERIEQARREQERREQERKHNTRLEMKALQEKIEALRSTL